MNAKGASLECGLFRLAVLFQLVPPEFACSAHRISVPFELRLLNGLNRPVPEVTVLIHKIINDRRAGECQLSQTVSS